MNSEMKAKPKLSSLSLDRVLINLFLCGKALDLGLIIDERGPKINN